MTEVTESVRLARGTIGGVTFGATKHGDRLYASLANQGCGSVSFQGPEEIEAGYLAMRRLRRASWPVAGLIIRITGGAGKYVHQHGGATDVRRNARLYTLSERETIKRVVAEIRSRGWTATLLRVRRKP